MAKHRNSKIKQSSEIIIALLKNGKTVAQIVAMGYPRGTVKYYNRKLFYPESYERHIKQIAKYNKDAL